MFSPDVDNNNNNNSLINSFIDNNGFENDVLGLFLF